MVGIFFSQFLHVNMVKLTWRHTAGLMSFACTDPAGIIIIIIIIFGGKGRGVFFSSLQYHNALVMAQHHWEVIHMPRVEVESFQVKTEILSVVVIIMMRAEGCIFFFLIVVPVLFNWSVSSRVHFKSRLWSTISISRPNICFCLPHPSSFRLSSRPGRQESGHFFSFLSRLPSGRRVLLHEVKMEDGGYAYSLPPINLRWPSMAFCRLCWFWVCVRICVWCVCVCMWAREKERV